MTDNIPNKCLINYAIRVLINDTHLMLPIAYQITLQKSTHWDNQEILGINNKKLSFSIAFCYSINYVTGIII